MFSDFFFCNVRCRAGCAEGEMPGIVVKLCQTHAKAVFVTFSTTASSVLWEGPSPTLLFISFCSPYCVGLTFDPQKQEPAWN